jgi:predicted ribosomally synthesized peptide with nif11-like leader
MSTDNVYAFLTKLGDDNSLLQKIEEAQGDVNALVAVGKSAGFDFSADELKSVMAQKNDAEMSEQQLAQVAGGGGLFAAKSGHPTTGNGLSVCCSSMNTCTCCPDLRLTSR